ncbi:MAG TPA: hypothetical protein PLX89_07330 [Verrucomicrobiota bacterium]|nr:hypothetical protein [Verrucomicrobiota bacterium]
MNQIFGKRFRLLLLAVFWGIIAGCKSDDNDVSERPWNAPKSWETGLPSGLGEGR